MLPTIFFDLDDTLFDYQSAKNAAVFDFYTSTQHSVKRSYHNQREAIKAWDEVTFTHMEQYHRGKLTYAEQQQLRVKAFLGLELTQQQAQQLYDRYQKLYEQHWRAFNDVQPTLTALKHKGFDLAIITDGPPQQRHKLERLAIEPFFEHMTIPQEVGRPKPEPKIFGLAACKAQKSVAQCWYVGNHFEKDFMGALMAGYKSVWLNRSGETTRDQAQQLNASAGKGWCIQSLDELIPIITHNIKMP